LNGDLEDWEIEDEGHTEYHGETSNQEHGMKHLRRQAFIVHVELMIEFSK